MNSINTINFNIPAYYANFGIIDAVTYFSSRNIFANLKSNFRNTPRTISC